MQKHIQTDQHKHTQTHIAHEQTHAHPQHTNTPTIQHTNTQTHKHTDNTTHKHTNTQTHKHTDDQKQQHPNLNGPWCCRRVNLLKRTLLTPPSFNVPATTASRRLRDRLPLRRALPRLSNPSNREERELSVFFCSRANNNVKLLTSMLTCFDWLNACARASSCLLAVNNSLVYTVEQSSADSRVAKKQPGL